MATRLAPTTFWLPVQAVGPVAITSLLLSNGLQDLIAGSDVNVNPNDPANPAAQVAWNHAAIQVGNS